MSTVSRSESVPESTNVPAASAPDAPAVVKRRNPIPFVLGGIVLIGAGIFGFRQWSFGQTHVSTDDAYVMGNLVNVGPTISGTLVSLRVSEGDTIHNGDLIAQLDDNGAEANLRQAEAALVAAQSQVPQARATLAFQERSTQASIDRANAAATSTAARATGARAQVELTRATVAAQVSQAQAQIDAARLQSSQQAAQARASQAAIAGFEKAADAGRRGVDALRARISAADAELSRAEKDEARFKTLLSQEAVTQQQLDSIRTQAEAARASRSALDAQIAQALAQVAQADAAVVQAKAQYDVARRGARASEAQIPVAQRALQLARTGGGQIEIRRSDAASADAQNPQAAADVSSARASTEQVKLRREQVLAAQAQVAQARAARDNAIVLRNKTRLYAHNDGIVVRKAVNEGVALSPGQTIVTITQGDTAWVTANFKETQISKLRLGQPVSMRVDALPGRDFRGRIASIQPTTGATVSLLPPDNATGNFTKVVQRIPVRIAFTTEAGITGGDLKRLRQGMSVVATVDISDEETHPELIPAGWDGRGKGGAKPVKAAAK